MKLRICHAYAGPNEFTSEGHITFSFYPLVKLREKTHSRASRRRLYFEYVMAGTSIPGEFYNFLMEYCNRPGSIAAENLSTLRRPRNTTYSCHSFRVKTEYKTDKGTKTERRRQKKVAPMEVLKVYWARFSKQIEAKCLYKESNPRTPLRAPKTRFHAAPRAPKHRAAA